jgi:vitellogenic carboxypeptidase-like protein
MVFARIENPPNSIVFSRNASVIYIDNPVGTGFSYTMDDQGYPNYVNQSSEDLYIALQQFFTIFSDFAQR